MQRKRVKDVFLLRKVYWGFYSCKFCWIGKEAWASARSRIHSRHICNGQVAWRLYTSSNNVTQKWRADVNGVQTCLAEYCRLVTRAKTEPNWSYKIQAQFADSSEKNHLAKYWENKYSPLEEALFLFIYFKSQCRLTKRSTSPFHF